MSEKEIPKQKIDLSYASLLIMKFDIQLIEEFRDHVIVAYNNRMTDLVKWFDSNRPKDYEDTDYYYDIELNASDEGETLDSIKYLTYELCLVALYRRIEINTGKLLSRIYSPKEIKDGKLYVMPTLVGRLRKDYKIDLRSLPHFKYADESRAINNSIKHGNKVNQDLVQDYSSNGWVLDTEMNKYDLNAHFNRISPSISLYFQELAIEVEKAK